MKEGMREAVAHEVSQFEKCYLWLEKSMPRVFFEEVSPEWLMLIVHALMGFQVNDYFSEIHLKNATITLTLDSPDADVKILSRLKHQGIRNYATYVSREPIPDTQNRYLRIAAIHFAQSFVEESERVKESEIIPHLKAKEAASLIGTIDSRFLRKMTPERQAKAVDLFYLASQEDHCQIAVEEVEGWEAKQVPSLYVILAWRNTPQHNFLHRLATLLHRYGLVMRRVNATYVHPYTRQNTLLLAFDLHGSHGEAASKAADLDEVLQELSTLKYFGTRDIFDKVFFHTNILTGNLVNLLRTLRYFIHQMLVHLEPHLYTLEKIEEGLCRHPELTVRLLEAFEAKFNGKKRDEEKYRKIQAELKGLIEMLDTGDELNDRVSKNILLQGVNFVEHALKTNFYVPRKLSFGFRLDPHFLEHLPYDRKKLFPELPYGVFFIKGMHYFGFHIRFRDLARGGLRTVLPEKKERMLAERNSVFVECYNLALTQQKKNKDIPEGGSKAIIFLKPFDRLAYESAILERELVQMGLEKEALTERLAIFKKEQTQEYLYQTQRAFISTLLSLVNCDANGKLKTPGIIDYYQKPEYIYLGPDENMHNVMIEWIAQESRRVGYKPGGAFISGKSRIGVNHKEYGVTSLGVNVCMHEILSYLGLDAYKMPFTVKMTGGPDGDVAGNQIHNLYRFYPKTAHLLALTDVSGTIFDPIGLDLEECMRLFKNGLSIRNYAPHKLHEGGFLLDRETRRELSPYAFQTLCFKKSAQGVLEEWLSGSEMNNIYRHTVHKTKADIFLPCGGRPRTLNEGNYDDFLDDKKEPTARAIIEGANLYLTQAARAYFEKLGVLVVKDSSANKGGVISSSFEILTGLALSDAEFLENKQALVDEILSRITLCCKNEMTTLLQTHTATHKPLTTISDEISYKINLFTDQLLAYLEPLTLSSDPHDPLIRTFLSYLPPFLREKYTSRMLDEIPAPHKKAIIASHIASQVVYRHGIDFTPTIVDILPLLIGK